MAVTTYGAHAPLYDAVAKIEKPAKKAGFWHGFWQAVVDARMRQAEREIALHRHLLPAEFELAGNKVGSKNEDSLPFAR